MLKNNGVLIVSLVALVLAIAGAVLWLRGRHGEPAAVSSAAPVILSAVAADASPSSLSPEAQPPAPPPPPAGEAAVDPQAAIASALPTQVGQCAATTVKDVSTRLQDTPGSGSAISFANGGYQVSYDQVPEVEASRPGDPVRICLVALPQDCPPGDVRGIVYKAANQRTGQSWTLPDSEHACGGA
jgi:hypothetical protein